jgi:hypothetical protein
MFNLGSNDTSCQRLQVHMMHNEMQMKELHLMDEGVQLQGATLSAQISNLKMHCSFHQHITDSRIPVHTTFLKD